jgi:hypothetical protein
MSMQFSTIIHQGATWSRVFTLRDVNGALVDLTSRSALMQVRPFVDSPTILMTPHLTLGGIAGTITATILPVESEGLDLSAQDIGTVTELFATADGVLTDTARGPLVYSDLKLTFSDGLTVQRILDATICISKEVSRA